MTVTEAMDRARACADAYSVAVHRRDALSRRIETERLHLDGEWLARLDDARERCDDAREASLVAIRAAREAVSALPGGG